VSSQTFAVNASNDLYIDGSGNLAIFYNRDAVLQNCEHVAKAQLGEMVLDTDQGIPYFQTVWNGVPNLPQFQAALRRAFLGVADVVEVVSLIVSQVDDGLGYTAIIRTIYGTGAINGV